MFELEKPSIDYYRNNISIIARMIIIADCENIVICSLPETCAPKYCSSYVIRGRAGQYSLTAVLDTFNIYESELHTTSYPTWRVVYFWSAACPCVTACENYSIIPLAKQYRGKVAFYGIVSGGYDLGLGDAALQKIIAARHLPYPVLLDKDHPIATALHAQVTPETFVIDPQGRVVFSGMPDDSRRFLGTKGGGVKHTYLANALRQALSGKAVTLPHTENEGCVIAW